MVVPGWQQVKTARVLRGVLPVQRLTYIAQFALTDQSWTSPALMASQCAASSTAAVDLPGCAAAWIGTMAACQRAPGMTWATINLSLPPRPCWMACSARRAQPDLVYRRLSPDACASLEGAHRATHDSLHPYLLREMAVAAQAGELSGSSNGSSSVLCAVVLPVLLCAPANQPSKR